MRGKTPMMLIAMSSGQDVTGATECVQALIAANADINLRDARGRTALFHAVTAVQGRQSGHQDFVRLFENALDKAGGQDNYGTTALEWAAREAEAGMVEVLL